MRDVRFIHGFVLVLSIVAQLWLSACGGSGGGSGVAGSATGSVGGAVGADSVAG